MCVISLREKLCYTIHSDWTQASMHGDKHLCLLSQHFYVGYNTTTKSNTGRKGFISAQVTITEGSKPEQELKATPRGGAGSEVEVMKGLCLLAHSSWLAQTAF